MKRLGWDIKSVAKGIAALMLITGCADTPENLRPAGSLKISTAEFKLTAAKSCGDLDDYIKEVAKAEFLKKVEMAQSGNYYYDGGDDMELAMPTAGDTSLGSQEGGTDGGSASKGGSSISHSETNNQVAGVDENDLVKTDGKYIYSVTNNVLRILRTLPAEKTQLVSETKVDRSHSIFLNGDRLLVFSRNFNYQQLIQDSVSEGTSSDGAIPNEMSTQNQPKVPAWIDGLRGQITVLTVFDISDRSNPTVERREALEGTLASARMIDGTVHAVLRDNLRFPPMNVPYGLYDGGSDDGAADIPVPVSSASSSSAGAPAEDSAEAPTSDVPWKEETKPEPVDVDQLIATYNEIVDGLTLDDLLPRRNHESAAGDISSDTLTPCEGFYKPAFQLGTQLVTVVTTDLNKDNASVAAVSTIGHVNTVYANHGSLYTASYVHNYWYWQDAENKNDSEFTAVHKFNLSAKGAAYLASGKVPGRILNQFSLDEHNDHLRIATTERNWNNPDLQSTNGVYVLGQSVNNLKVVGSVTGLAENERIYSARFMGDRGYVVTFRQVDPLFTLDLSNPTNPMVKGELKIPGFSTYIHPLGPDHLLTIGQETKDNGDWVSIDGMQVQIFDVSDMSNPKLAHKSTMKGHSEALRNHKAFNFFADKGLLAIPYNGGYDNDIEVAISDTEWEEEGEGWKPPKQKRGVLVFKVDTEKGLSEHGFISTESLSNNNYGQVPSRTLLIEDHLYSIGRSGVVVNQSWDLSEVAAVKFQTKSGFDGGEPDTTEPVVFVEEEAAQ